MIYLYLTVAWLIGHFTLEWIVWKLPFAFYMDVGSKILSAILWAITMVTYYAIS